jgi:hypothetical protein
MSDFQLPYEKLKATNAPPRKGVSGDVQYVQCLFMVFSYPINGYIWGIRSSRKYFITIPSRLISPKLQHSMKQGKVIRSPIEWRENKA